MQVPYVADVLAIHNIQKNSVFSLWVLLEHLWKKVVWKSPAHWNREPVNIQLESTSGLLTFQLIGVICV